MYDSPLVAGAFASGETASPRVEPPDDTAVDPSPEPDRADEDEPIDVASESDQSTGSDGDDAKPAQSASAEASRDESGPAESTDTDASRDDSPPALASRRSASSSDSSPASEPAEPADEEARDSTDTDNSGTTTGTAQTSESSDSRPDSTAAQYAAAIYELNGVEISEEAHVSIPDLYRTCRNRGAVFQEEKPAAGDLVFFHNVRDANGDGRNNDWYTHVALVEGVDDGTVALFGYRDGRVRSFRMNLETPEERRSGGETINTRLREPSEDDPPYSRYLAGELFAGYCSMLGDRSELVVVDNWEPGMELEPPDRN